MLPWLAASKGALAFADERGTGEMPVTAQSQRKLYRKGVGYRSFALMGAVAILAFGCGGSGDEAEPSSSSKAPSTTPTLSPQELVSQASAGTVELSGKQGDGSVGGTGILYDADKGLVITNAHVVSGTSGLKARIGDGPRVPARVLGTSYCDDLAVVEVTRLSEEARALPLGDSDEVVSQDEVFTLGFPASFEEAETQNVVSARGAVQSEDVQAAPDDWLPTYPSTIQHDATVNPGNSGGPLINDRGEVIGVNSLGNEGEGLENQFYSISINYAKPIIERLSQGQNDSYVGWDLGPFSDVPLSEIFVSTGYGTAEQGQQADEALGAAGVDGLFVFGSDPGSPAADGFIEGGDLITRIKGTAVTTVSEMCDVVQSASLGETLSVEGRYLTNSGDNQFGEEWTTEVDLDEPTTTTR